MTHIPIPSVELPQIKLWFNLPTRPSMTSERPYLTPFLLVLDEGGADSTTPTLPLIR